MTGNRFKSNWKGLILPMVIVAFMFSVLGFAVGINAFFVPFVKNAFKIDTAMSYLVTTATFSAFVLFGPPSGKILKKIGYRKSIFVSFIFMALGIFLIIPAARWISFPMFLLALFVNGTGQTLLNTSVNPYITILGPEKSAAKRISIMGICNKLSFGLAPVILAVFMDTVNVRLDDVIIPFYSIAFILILLSVLTYFSPLPEVKALGEGDRKIAGDGHKNNLFHYPHLLLGFLAIFLYVGVETIILVSINDFAHELGLPSPDNFALYASAGYIIGYLSGIVLIPKKVSQTGALIFCALLGIGLSLLVVILPCTISVYPLALLGLANSLIWPAVWPLALAGLGDFTKTGSAILVMGIAGGGVLPPLAGLIKDYSSYHQAYWILLPVYLYFFYYAVKGHKIKIREIGH